MVGSNPIGLAKQKKTVLIRHYAQIVFEMKPIRIPRISGITSLLRRGRKPEPQPQPEKKITVRTPEESAHEEFQNLVEKLREPEESAEEKIEDRHCAAFGCHITLGWLNQMPGNVLEKEFAAHPEKER